MSDALANRTLTIVANHLGVDTAELSADTSFEELGLDSFDVVTIIDELEREYDVFVPNDAALGISTIGDAVAELEQLVAQKSNGEASA